MSETENSGKRVTSPMQQYGGREVGIGVLVLLLGLVLVVGGALFL